MPQAINFIILITELVLLYAVVKCIINHTNIEENSVVLWVFGVDLAIYLVPVFYAKLVTNPGQSFLLNFLEGFSATVKQFVGEFAAERVTEYASIYPIYIWIFGLGAGLTVLTSFYAVISLFGCRFRNKRRLIKMLRGKTCDIVLGNSPDALEYAKKNSNTVLMLNETVDKDYTQSLMEDGYILLKRNFTEEFLKGHMLNATTRYHIVYPGDNKEFFDVIEVFLSYLETDYNMKQIFLYAEVNESIAETVQDRIAGKAKADGRNYREYITIFSKNELMARAFVEENPITRYMPASFLEKDKSMKPGTEINVFMLGFGALSKEIYKQFVINNQLAQNCNGEYKVFQLQYHIYDKFIDKSDYCIEGLKHDIAGTSRNAGAYFPAPEMPYNTTCVECDGFSTDRIAGICNIVMKPNSMSYIIIDIGDVYHNIKLCKELRLHLEEYEHYHIFIRNGSRETDCDGVTDSYGNTRDVLMHEIIVNETIIELAKRINQKHAQKDPNKKLRTMEENWKALSYFHTYNNIYLANGLRLKLNLLGLDYVKDGKGTDINKITDSYQAHFEGETDAVNIKKALLAQEHFRWNAYHLMSGYRPMEKSLLAVKTQTPVEDCPDRMDYIIETNKLPESKKHSCLTTFDGVGEVSEYLANLANKLYSDKKYTASDFDYYKNDAMLFEVAPGFFEEKGYSVIEIFKEEELC